MAIRTHISIITLNIIGINDPIKKHKVAEWIQKQDPFLFCLRESLIIQRHTQSESKGMEKAVPWKWKSKKQRVAIVISDKLGFKIKMITSWKKDITQLLIK